MARGWENGFLPSTCAATLWVEEGFVEHRRAIAAVEKCQFDALFQAFLALATVVVG